MNKQAQAEWKQWPLSGREKIKQSGNNYYYYYYYYWPFSGRKKSNKAETKQYKSKYKQCRCLK